MTYRTRRRADSVQVGDMIHTMRGWQRVQARRDRPGTGPVLRPMVSIEVEAPLGSASSYTTLIYPPYTLVDVLRSR